MANDWTPGTVLAPAALTPNAVQAILAALTPEQALAGTAWAEARARLDGGVWRANPPEAMHDVMDVVRNRAADPRWAHLGIKGVCLQPWAFSCWSPHAGADNDHDPQHLADNFEALLGRVQLLLAGQAPTDALLACLAMAEAPALTGSPVDGATHYYATWLTAPPRWAAPPAQLVAERFCQRFYRHVA